MYVDGGNQYFTESQSEVLLTRKSVRKTFLNLEAQSLLDIDNVFAISSVKVGGRKTQKIDIIFVKNYKYESEL